MFEQADVYLFLSISKLHVPSPILQKLKSRVGRGLKCRGLKYWPFKPRQPIFEQALPTLMYPFNIHIQEAIDKRYNCLQYFGITHHKLVCFGTMKTKVG